MQVPRDLLDQKLNALRIVLPTLLLESEPELYQKEFSKLSKNCSSRRSHKIVIMPFSAGSKFVPY